MKAGILLMSLIVVAAPARADKAADLAAAGQLLANGSYADAASRVAPLLADRTLLPVERAEALRIHGLATFFLGDRVAAEGSLRGYLELEPDAHLDPALYPPDAVVFFEDVRTRHAGALRIAKPPPKRKRY